MGLTWHQEYPGGRIVARSGSVDIGAVFPDFSWRMWIGRLHPIEGKTKSRLAAQNALANKWTEWLSKARLKADKEAG